MVKIGQIYIRKHPRAGYSKTVEILDSFKETTVLYKVLTVVPDSDGSAATGVGARNRVDYYSFVTEFRLLKGRSDYIATKYKNKLVKV